MLAPKLYYNLRKKLFTSFNDIVESTYHIEDIAIKKGDIVLKNTKVAMEMERIEINLGIKLGTHSMMEL